MKDGYARLHPQLRAALGNTPIYDLTRLSETRQLDAAFGRMLSDASITAAPDLGRVMVQNIRIPGQDGYVMDARLYRPAGADEPLSALLMCHGGAFCLGDLDTEDFRCRRYARDAGCAVLNIDYRLAPEHRFPVPFEDCYAALVWLAANAPTFCIDPKRLGVAGESAGGALAAATVLAARDRGGPDLAVQMLLFPVLDHRMLTASMRAGESFPAWTTHQTRLAWSLYLGPECATIPAYASPGTADNLRGLPVTFVACAEIDPLHDEAMDYACRLREASVRTEVHSYLGGYHVFDAIWPTTALSQLALQQQIIFLLRYLRCP